MSKYPQLTKISHLCDIKYGYLGLFLLLLMCRIILLCITKKLSLHWQLSRKSSCCVPMCIRCHLQAETPCEVSVIFIHHLWTFWMDLRGDVKNLQLVLELDSGHKTRVNKTVNLYNYLRFCSNIMCIAGPNNNLWLTEVIGVDINGHSMPNDSNFALFLQLGVLWVRMGANWRFGDFVVMVILEMKITAFTYLLSSDSEGYDSFPKHLDLALAPNKTNEWGWEAMEHSITW